MVVIIGLPEIEEFHWVQIEKKGGMFAHPFIHLQKYRESLRRARLCPRAGDTAMNWTANLSALGEVASRHGETDTNK